MEIRNLKWNERLKNLVLSYQEVRKVYLDDVDKIKLILKEDISNDKYHLYDTYIDDVKFIIYKLTLDNNNINNMTIFLLSNNHESIADIYYDIRWSNDRGFKSTYYTLYYDLDISMDLFFDDEVGIVKNFSRVMNNRNFMLSDIYKLSDISKMELKDDTYYLYGNKYLSKEEYNKYANKVFEEMSNGKIKKQLYFSLRHYGPYEQIYKTYNKLMDKIKEHNMKIVGIPMECFVNGRWNKDNPYEYVTNIMIPVK